MKADHSRRYFCDFDSLGNVIFSAPKRTEFDEREKWQHGNSAVEGQSGSMATDQGFSGEIELGGRIFLISVRSFPKESIT